MFHIVEKKIVYAMHASQFNTAIVVNHLLDGCFVVFFFLMEESSYRTKSNLHQFSHFPPHLNFAPSSNMCVCVFVHAGEFTERDVEVFRRYLTFCGIGIQNAQLFEMSVQEYRRNQILLNLARSIFEEQNNLECLVTKILTEARELLKCKRCVVFLFDLDFCESVRIIQQHISIVYNSFCQRNPSRASNNNNKNNNNGQKYIIHR